MYATMVAGFRRFRTRDIVTMCLYTDLFDIILNLRTLLVILLRKKKEFHLIVINAHNGKTEIIVVNVYTYRYNSEMNNRPIPCIHAYTD